MHPKLHTLLPCPREVLLLQLSPRNGRIGVSLGMPRENSVLIDKLEDVETILASQRIKLPRANAADKRTYENAAKHLILVAHAYLDALQRM